MKKSIFIINLKNRTDRWEKCVKQLKDYDITDYERFEAIKPSFDTINPLEYSKFNMRLSQSYIVGAMGCKLSHLEIIKEAKRRNLDSVCILEDDFFLCKDFVRKFERVLNEIDEKSINMLYLGFSLVRKDAYTDTHISNIKKMVNAHTTHAYVMYKTFYDSAIQEIEKCYSEVDVCYANIQKKYSGIYGVFPCLVTQEKSYSDITGGPVDYSNVIVLDN